MIPESARGIAAGVQRGSFAARAVTERSLERIEARDGKVNSCVEVLAAEALAAADRIDSGQTDPRELPLAGVPLAIKEIIPVRGARSSWGCPLLADRRADADDSYVRKLREAGAIIVATTNVPELSCWGTTDNPVYGPTKNPHDLTRTAGGSSGGSGAAVALGLVPLAIGSDAGGSVRIPASFCGVAGFKPSFSVMPADETAEINRLNVIGPLARDSADLALCAEVLSPALAAPNKENPTAALEDARITATADLGYAPVEAHVREVFKAAIQRLSVAGLEVDTGASATAWRSPLEYIVRPLACEVYAAFEEILERDDHGLSAATVRVASVGKKVSGIEYFRCLEGRSEFEAEWARFFAEFDLLLAPTTQVAAFDLGRNGPSAIDGVAIDPDADGSWYPTAFTANVIGAPAISIPCGKTAENLPVGLQVMGAPGRDRLVLAAAARIESILSR